MNDGLWKINWEKGPCPEGYMCDIAQYRMLERCSNAKNTDEWNTWRKNNRGTEIWLQGANLSNFYLQGIDFNKAHCERVNFWVAHCEGAVFNQAHCEGAVFNQAHCEETKFLSAHCEEVRFGKAHCNRADFRDAHCEKADFTLANCEEASFYFAHCKEGIFEGARCGGANFTSAHCEGALFIVARCEEAIFDRAYLSDACFYNTMLSSSTSFLECKVNSKTLFTNSSLSSIMTEPGTRALLERNVRQAEWKKWYKDHPIQQGLVRFFWHISDYGYSTRMVFRYFLAGWGIFSFIYCINPGLLVKTVATGQLESLQWIWCNGIDWLQLPLFALATMVTLGFGNINAANTTGMLVVCLNLMVGYFLLAVLITRLAVLFQTMGPGRIVPKELPRKP